MNLIDIQSLISKLRTHREDPDLDNRSKGLLGTILGELRIVENKIEIEIKKQSIKSLEIIHEWDNDPVIRAYLNQKKDWEEKISDLRFDLNIASNGDEDNY